MQILRATDYKRMPWKNGGGETVEIAVFPHDASVENFAWRVSMATVASDGPFSIFPGIDRTLSILQGAGMVLEIDGRPPVSLDIASDPLAFAADVPVMAMLVDGAITDLNVMTRRGRFSHSVVRLEAGEGDVALPEGSLVMLMTTGEAHLHTGGEAVSLVTGDAVLIAGAETSEVLKYVSGAPLYFIRLDALTHG